MILLLSVGPTLTEQGEQSSKALSFGVHKAQGHKITWEEETVQRVCQRRKKEPSNRTRKGVDVTCLFLGSWGSGLINCAGRADLVSYFKPRLLDTELRVS